MTPLSLTVHQPDGAALGRETTSTLAVARATEIDSPELYELAAEDLKRVKARFKELETQRKAITKPLDEAKEKVMALFRAPLDQLSQAEATLKRNMLAFTTAEKKRADEEQARIAREAAAEQARIAAAARNKEREAAALLQAAQDAQAAQAAMGGQDPKSAAEDVETLAQAAQAASEAQALAQAASVMTVPVVAPARSRVAGLSARVLWDAELTDIVALCRHIAENPEMCDLVQLNAQTARQMAGAMKQNLNIPGIKAVSRESLASR